jgi:uncharacterized protein YjbI with pentapeptide repeats
MPDPADIARRKAEIELALLEEQLTPASRRREWVKALASASGVILAVVALLGAVVSAGEWFASQRKDRDVRTEERFERALSLLSEARPPQRAAALTSLGSFIDANNQQRDRQVLVSVANALPLEDDPSVRGAMVSFFDDIDPQAVGTLALDAALKSLSYASRDLVQRSDYWHERDTLFPFVGGSKDGAAMTALERAMAGLMRKGARNHNMAGTYLEGADLSKLDLTGTNFDDAIVNGANFGNAALVGASFVGADIEGAHFVRADLRLAQFRYSTDATAGGAHNNFVQFDFLRALWQFLKTKTANAIVVSQPDFSCADLRGADFSGSYLVGLNPDDMTQFLSGAAQFQGADLAAANFDGIVVYALVPGTAKAKPALPLPVSVTESTPMLDKYVFVQALFGRRDATSGDAKDYDDTLDELRSSFDGTNWTKAKLPPEFARWLAADKPSGLSVVTSCKPRHPH